MSKGRRPTQEELKLWRWAMRQARPMSRGGSKEKPASSQDSSEFEALLRASSTPRMPLRAPVVMQRSAGKNEYSEAVSPPAPPFSSPQQIDQSLVRHLARGRRQVDAVLDLHGARQNEAHERLIRFIEGAQSRGNRILLVITGKGMSAPSGPGAGVLRRMLPEWLRQAPLVSLVSGFEPSHRRHGGSGAFYVIVRRNNREGL